MFIVYRASDKCPVGTDGTNIDGQDSANWMIPAEAEAWAQILGESYGVGIVLYEGCGLGCVDVDGALQEDGTWSPVALGLCARFSGAYMEVSMSGRGLHLIFRCDDPPTHSTKNVQLHIEFYTAARYIALTGINATGSVSFDGTALVPALVQDFFPPKTAHDVAGWTDEPHPDWNGPEDDEALLALMLRSSSARAKFGKGVTFSDLWNNNVDKLREAWPSSTGKDYDGSSADQSLANMLAFWTGNDCERMLTLMRISALARPKYDRPDYLPNTILQACGWQKEFYTSNRLVPAAPPVGAPAPRLADATPSPAGGMVPPPPDGPPLAPEPVEGETGRGKLVLAQDQARLFEGCTYVEDLHQVLLPPPLSFTLDKPQFDIRYGGRDFQLEANTQKTTDSAWDVFTKSKIEDFRKVRGMYFAPQEEPNAIIYREGVALVNSWVPIDIPRVTGDASKFTNHIKTLFPVDNDADIIIYYLAAMLQHMGTKAAWCLFLQGVEGNGKSLISDIMEKIIGERYTHRAKASELDSRFNGPFYGKIFIPVEDVQISEKKSSVWETLKPMIDRPRLEIESKGVNKVTREVCFNLILNSNHKDGIRKTQNDRRIAPFFAAQQFEADLARDGLTPAYFVDMWAWLNADGIAIIADYLLRLEIPDEYNFAKSCRRAPRTSSTDAAKAESMGSIEQDILDAVDNGQDGFAGGWVSSIAVDNLIAASAARGLSRNKRRGIMNSLGYAWHPGLPDGRLTGGITGSPGIRPRLYIKPDHSSRGITDQPLIRQLYEAAQAAARK